MTNIILLVKDRPRLTEQCLRTLYLNTKDLRFNLLIVNDGSGIETRTVLVNRYDSMDNAAVVTFEASIGIVGFLRNVGAWASERYFGRGDWLCFLDNDVALFPGWLERMGKEMTAHCGEVLGGCQHPYHGVNVTRGPFLETDAVAGYSLFMHWNTWDKYGPFASNQKGVGASEDYAFCRKIVEDGGRVGYIHPPVLAHCGVTNTDGKPATGADQFPRLPGLIYE